MAEGAMHFAVFFTPKAGSPEERVKLTREWPFPEGLRSVRWYHFPSSELRWMEIFEADNVSVLMDLVKAFDPFYEIKVLPAESGTRA